MDTSKWVHAECPIHKIPFVVKDITPNKTTFVCPKCQEDSRGGAKKFWENIDKLQRVGEKLKDERNNQ